jgi:hypothetical protein
MRFSPHRIAGRVLGLFLVVCVVSAGLYGSTGATSVGAQQNPAPSTGIDSHDTVTPSANGSSSNRTGGEIPSRSWKRIVDTDGSTSINAVAATESGDVVVAGSRFVNGERDAFIVRLDSEGEVGWQRTFDSTEGRADRHDEIHAAVATENGFVLAGTGGADIDGSTGWLLAVTGEGDKRWERRYGARGASFRTATASSEDGYVVGGIHPATGDGSDGQRAWLLEASTTGEVTWDRVYESLPTGRISAISDDGDGFVVGGRARSTGWIGTVRSDGRLTQSSTLAGAYQVRSIDPTRDGTYVLTGAGDGAKGTRNVWIARTEPDGTTRWNRSIAEYPW